MFQKLYLYQMPCLPNLIIYNTDLTTSILRAVIVTPAVELEALNLRSPVA